MLPSIFDDVFGDMFEKNSNEVMKTDVRIVGDNYLLDIAVPGYEKQDIKLELEQGYLTIVASRDENNDIKDGKYLRRERYYGKCSRTFYVGNDISEEDIKANYKNGILTVTLPKTSLNQTKKVIEIED